MCKPDRQAENTSLKDAPPLKACIHGLWREMARKPHTGQAMQETSSNEYQDHSQTLRI
jgi:hypothetical protein